MQKSIKILLSAILLTVLTSCASHPTAPSLDMGSVQQKAESGDKHAQYQLALLHRSYGHFPEALEWLQKAAAQDYPLAQNELGNIYLEGRVGEKKDSNQAFAWYQKAAQGGYFDAINNLGYLYDLGKGTDQDHAKAAQLYELAASKGSIRAMYNLGLLYQQGQGVEKDMVQAYKWFDLARYYTGRSRDMSLKWAIRKQWDELEATMSSSEKKEARELATQWQKSIVSNR